MIGSGSFKESAVDLMKRVLQSVDHDLHKLQQLSLEHLVQFNGIGIAKAVKIKTALELSKRLVQKTQNKVPVLNHSKVAFENIRY